MMLAFLCQEAHTRYETLGGGLFAWGWCVVTDPESEHLRVLIANERRDRLALLVPIVAALGHEVIASEIDVEDVGPATAR